MSRLRRLPIECVIRITRSLEFIEQLLKLFCLEAGGARAIRGGYAAQIAVNLSSATDHDDFAATGAE
jgi:hypothetical protein